MQHLTEDSIVPPNLPGDSLPFEKANSIAELQTISTQAAFENQKMAASDPFTNSSQDMSASVEAQGTSPTCEDQIMALPDQVTEPLRSQHTDAAPEAQRTSSIYEDHIMTAPDQITDSLPYQNTSLAAVAQGTSSQAVAEDQEMALSPDSVKEPPTVQKVIEPQDYSLELVTEDQEMEVIDITEAFLPSRGADESSKPRGSSLQSLTEEQERQGMAIEDSADSAPLPSQKTMETQGSAMILISEENITASLQSSPQTKIRIPTPLVSSDCVGNVSSPVQDLQPLTLPTFRDNLINDSPCSTMPGEISHSVYVSLLTYSSLSREIRARDAYCHNEQRVEKRVHDDIYMHRFKLSVSKAVGLA